MKSQHRAFLLVIGLAPLPGCSDTWNSLNQMEKNVSNEVIDLLAQVKDEDSAAWIAKNLMPKVKDKYEAVKTRKEKYLKTNFINSLHDMVAAARKDDPTLSNDQVIAILKQKDEKFKKGQDIKDYLSVTSLPDHVKELQAIDARLHKELARVASLSTDQSDKSPFTVVREITQTIFQAKLSK